MRFAHFRDDLIRLVQCLEVIGGEESMAGVREHEPRAFLGHLYVVEQYDRIRPRVRRADVLLSCRAMRPARSAIDL